jgi:GNAT superfamily N-acetyltransferase
MPLGVGWNPGLDEAGYAVYESAFVLSWGGRARIAHVHPLTIRDLNERTRREWRGGRVIGWSDLQDYARRRVTLVMKHRGRVLGVLHLCEPRLPAKSGRPEVVAVESNPRIRRRVRGVGTGLIAAAVMVSKEWGYGGAIELTADREAVEFYLHLGMKRRRGRVNRFYFDERGANEFLRAYLSRLSRSCKPDAPLPYTYVRRAGGRA